MVRVKVMSLKQIRKLAFPGNWQKSVGDYFKQWQSIALILHPFYQVPSDLITALEPDEYQADNSIAKGLETIRWDYICEKLSIKDRTEIGYALISFIFKEIEVRQRPENLEKLMSLKKEGILLPMAHGIPSDVAERIRLSIAKKYGDCLWESEDSMAIASPYLEAVGVCLADQFFTYVAGPEDWIATLVKDETLEITVVSKGASLTWYE